MVLPAPALAVKELPWPNIREIFPAVAAADSDAGGRYSFLDSLLLIIELRGEARSDRINVMPYTIAFTFGLCTHC
jgi:hypothetical protein